MGRALAPLVAIVLLQMFIVVPWAIAYWCVRSGSMPLKHGGRIDRAAAPRQFWMGVWFMAAAGTMFFVLNLCLAWMVVSRSASP